MRGGSKTFFAASLLLPDRVRTPAIALYAFCRLADDAVDLDGDPAARLADLQRRLRQIYAGQPLPLDADQALTEVVAHFDIPHDLPAALLEGFEWDAEGRQYETLEDVHAYGARVAGTVGAMMSLIMGARNAHALARACELGVAMQLTNIARDVGEDARRGRIYLPIDDMQRFNVKAADLLNARYVDGFAALMQFEANRARALYRDALAALPAADRRAQRPGLIMGAIYLSLLAELERSGFQVLHQRIALTPLRKFWIAWRTWVFGPPSRLATL